MGVGAQLLAPHALGRGLLPHLQELPLDSQEVLSVFRGAAQVLHLPAVLG